MCSRKPDGHIPSTFVAAGMMPPRANHAWTVFCAQGAALVASRGSQGLAPGLERLSRAARARPLASGTSARMSMRLLTVACGGDDTACRPEGGVHGVSEAEDVRVAIGGMIGPRKCGRRRAAIGTALTGPWCGA